MHEYAKLLKLGFQQAQKKPWLFLLKLPKKRVVFANMGGTEEVPIWSDPTPMIHWQLKVPEWEEEMIVQEIINYCERRYLPTRLSFYSGHYYPGNQEDEADE